MKKLFIILVIILGIGQAVHGQRYIQSNCGNLRWNTQRFQYQPVVYSSWIQPRANWSFGFWGNWNTINTRFDHNSFWWERRTYIVPCQQSYSVWDPYWRMYRIQTFWTQCVYWY